MKKAEIYKVDFENEDQAIAFKELLKSLGLIEVSENHMESSKKSPVRKSDLNTGPKQPKVA